MQFVGLPCAAFPCSPESLVVRGLLLQLFRRDVQDVSVDDAHHVAEHDGELARRHLALALQERADDLDILSIVLRLDPGVFQYGDFADVECVWITHL